MLQALNVARQEAGTCGYSDNTIKLAVFAVAAFLDESALNTRLPVFANWAGKPLGEELFDKFVSGEDFFRYVRRLLSQTDSAELGDLLEVYQLCLLAGYRGQYGMSENMEVTPVIDAIRQKRARIRAESAEFTDAWKLPAHESIPPQTDSWLRRLVITCAASLVVVIILYTGFNLSLNSAMRDLRTINVESRR